jgi:murein DD-endopeptidase MepM/ murein hydrolase activator NlpD
LFHEGVDISNEIGTPIHATANGVVAFCGTKDYYGNVVVLSHPASGYKTIFGHLKKAAVFEGQVVKRGDVIGYLGNTGRSTGPHVHYEVHRLNDMVNPLDYVLPTDTMVD